MYKQKTLPSAWTPFSVREAYREDGHFFDRDTMGFFGDTMQSFACISIAEEDYMYRKKGATVNVFGREETVSREFFGCWRIVREDNGRVNLDCVSADEMDFVFNCIYNKGKQS